MYKHTILPIFVQNQKKWRNAVMPVMEDEAVLRNAISVIIMHKKLRFSCIKVVTQFN